MCTTSQKFELPYELNSHFLILLTLQILNEGIKTTTKKTYCCVFLRCIMTYSISHSYIRLLVYLFIYSFIGREGGWTNGSKSPRMFSFMRQMFPIFFVAMRHHIPAGALPNFLFCTLALCTNSCCVVNSLKTVPEYQIKEEQKGTK